MLITIELLVLDRQLPLSLRNMGALEELRSCGAYVCQAASM